jgi:hypothetical protein
LRREVRLSAAGTVFVDGEEETAATPPIETRVLYEAILSKHRAYGAFEGAPTGEDLLHNLLHISPRSTSTRTFCPRPSRRSADE